MKKLDFNVRVETDHDTGQILAVYLRVRKGRVSQVREFDNGNVFVNYGCEGQLLGIEILGPCRVTLLSEKIGRREPREVKSFFRESIPAKMAVA